MKIILAGLVCLVNGIWVQAANISGSVQASYNYNLTIPGDSTANVGHSYDAKSKTFTLNNAHLTINGSDTASGLGYAIGLDAGSDAMMNSTFSTGAAYLLDVQEAYLTYALGSSGLGLKAGKYVTYEGIEVVAGGANPTITRGFLFGMAECVSHTGVELSFSSGMFEGHIGAINGWDLMVDNNTMPSIMAKVGLNLGDPLMIAVSGIMGPEQTANTDDMRTSVDLVGVTKLIPKVDLWFQGNYGMESFDATKADSSASWLGFGVQPLVHLSEKFGLGLRYEYFSDPDGVRAILGKDINLQTFSVAPTFWITTGLTARVEFRMDMASEDIYQDSDGAATGSQMQVAADMVASF